ncbi:MAG TPA: tripartite tricarboxylate transporter substrate binding protein, partial [Burkholderiales bacterium]|nr:tripartite tricarboxylate transporter substrate binding protein [Burkholderiales bacterium]
NRAGANGNIGGEIVVRSAPDGYTLLMGANGNIAINPSLYPHMPFDPLRDLAPVALIASSALLLVIHPSLPAASVRELIELAKHRAGAINVASAGNGSTAHLAAELFRTMAGIDITHIPYKGAGPALADVAAGQAQATITGVSGALPFVKSGKIRALGVTGPRRIALLPDVPTIAETLPGYEVETWYGVFAPAATPRTIVLALNQSLAVILASADARERMASLGAEIATGTPEQFGHAVRVEKDKWAKVVKQAGLRLD